MTVTAQMIAKKLNISSMTVSRAINNHPDIKEETKEKVLAVVKELNYTPNLLARALIQKKTYTLGLIIPSIAQEFFPEIVHGVQNLANKSGYNVTLGYSGENYEKERKEIEIMLQRKVDGLIIAPAQDTENIQSYLELIRSDIPFVFIDRHFKEIETNYVICSDKKGAYQAANHLIKLGHKRIAHITGPPLVSTSRNRLAGYRQALKENNIPFDETLIKQAGFEEEDGYKAMQELLKLSDIPTAIFAVGDHAAIGAMKAMETAGIKIPEEIAIVGFGDIKFASFLKIPLTTVIQPKYKLGEKSAKILLDRIESKAKNGIKKVVLKTTLVIRKSCGANSPHPSLSPKGRGLR